MRSVKLFLDYLFFRFIFGEWGNEADGSKENRQPLHRASDASFGPGQGVVENRIKAGGQAERRNSKCNIQLGSPPGHPPFARFASSAKEITAFTG